MFAPLHAVPNTDDFRKDEDSGVISKVFRGVLGLSALSASLGMGYTIGKKLKTNIYDKHRERVLNKGARKTAFDAAVKAEEQLYKTKVAYNKLARKTSRVTGLEQHKPKTGPGQWSGSYVHPDVQVVGSLFDDAVAMDKGIIQSSTVEDSLRDMLSITNPETVEALKNKEYSSFVVKHGGHVKQAQTYIDKLTDARAEVLKLEGDLFQFTSDREMAINKEQSVVGDIDKLGFGDDNAPSSDKLEELSDARRHIDEHTAKIRRTQERIGSIRKEQNVVKANMVDFYTNKEKVLIKGTKTFVKNLETEWTDIFRGIEKKYKGTVQESIVDVINEHGKKTKDAIFSEMKMMARKEGRGMSKIVDKVIDGIKSDWSSGQSGWSTKQKVKHISQAKVSTISKLVDNIDDVYINDKVPNLREGVIKIDLNKLNSLNSKVADKEIAKQSLKYIIKSEKYIEEFNLGPNYTSARTKLRELERHGAAKERIVRKFSTDEGIDLFLDGPFGKKLDGENLFKKYRKKVGYGFESKSRVNHYGAISSSRETNIYSTLKNLKKIAPHLSKKSSIILDMDDLDTVIKVVMQDGGKSKSVEIAKIPYMVNNVVVNPRTGYNNAIAGVVDVATDKGGITGVYKSYADFYTDKINDVLDDYYETFLAGGSVKNITKKKGGIPDLTDELKKRINKVQRQVEDVRTDMGGDDSYAKMVHKTGATTQYGKTAKLVNKQYVNSVIGNIDKRIKALEQLSINPANKNKRGLYTLLGDTFSESQLTAQIKMLQDEKLNLNNISYGNNKMRALQKTIGGENYYMFQGKMMKRFFDVASIVETSAVKGILNLPLESGSNITYDVPIEKKLTASLSAKQLTLKQASELDNLFPRNSLNRGITLWNNKARVADVPMKIAFIYGEHTKEGGAIFSMDAPGTPNLDPSTNVQMEVKVRALKKNTGGVQQYAVSSKSGLKGVTIARDSDGVLTFNLPKGKKTVEMLGAKGKPITIADGTKLLGDIRIADSGKESHAVFTYRKAEGLDVIGWKAASSNGSVKAQIHHVTDKWGVAELLKYQGVKETREKLAAMGINILAFNKIGPLGTNNIIERGKMILDTAVTQVYEKTNNEYVKAIKGLVAKARSKNFSIGQGAEMRKLRGFVDALKKLDEKKADSLITKIANVGRKQQLAGPEQVNKILKQFKLHDAAIAMAEERMANNIKNIYKYGTGYHDILNDTLDTTNRIKVGVIGKNKYRTSTELYEMLEDELGIRHLTDKDTASDRMVVNWDKKQQKVKVVQDISTEKYGDVTGKIAENPDDFYRKAYAKTMENDAVMASINKKGSSAMRMYIARSTDAARSQTILKTNHSNPILVLRQNVTIAAQDARLMEKTVAHDVKMSLGGARGGAVYGPVGLAMAKLKGLDRLSREIEHSMGIGKEYVHNYKAILADVISDSDAIGEEAMAIYNSAREKSLGSIPMLKSMRTDETNRFLHNKGTVLSEQMTSIINEGVSPEVAKYHPEALRMVDKAKIKGALLKDELLAYQKYVDKDSMRRVINLREMKFNVAGSPTALTAKVNIGGTSRKASREISRVFAPQLHGNGIDYWTLPVNAKFKDAAGKTIIQSTEIAHLNDVHKRFIDFLGVMEDGQKLAASGEITRKQYTDFQNNVNNSLGRYYKETAKHMQYIIKSKMANAGVRATIRGTAMPELGFTSKEAKNIFGVNVDSFRTQGKGVPKYRISPKPLSIAVSKSSFNEAMRGTTGEFRKVGELGILSVEEYTQAVMDGQRVHMANVVKYPIVTPKSMNSIRVRVFDDDKIPEHLKSHMRGKILINRLEQSVQQGQDFDGDQVVAKIATDERMNREFIADSIHDRVKIKYNKASKHMDYEGFSFTSKSLFKLPDYDANAGLKKMRFKIGRKTLEVDPFLYSTANMFDSVEHMQAADVLNYTGGAGQSAGKVVIKGSSYKHGYQNVKQYIAEEMFGSYTPETAEKEARRILRDKLMVDATDDISISTGLSEHTYDIKEVEDALAAHKKAMVKEFKDVGWKESVMDMANSDNKPRAQKLNAMYKDKVTRTQINDVLKKIKNNKLEPYAAVKEFTGKVTNDSQRLLFAAFDLYGVGGGVDARRKALTIANYTGSMTQNVISSKHLNPTIVGDYLDSVKTLSTYTKVGEKNFNMYMNKFLTGNYEFHKSDSLVSGMNKYITAFGLDDATSKGKSPSWLTRSKLPKMALQEQVEYLEHIKAKTGNYLKDGNKLSRKLRDAMSSTDPHKSAVFQEVEGLLTAAGRDVTIDSNLDPKSILKLLKKEAGRVSGEIKHTRAAMKQVSMNKIIGKDAAAFFKETFFPTVSYAGKNKLFNDASYTMIRGKSLNFGSANAWRVLTNMMKGEGPGFSAATQRQMLSNHAKAVGKTSIAANRYISGTAASRRSISHALRSPSAKKMVGFFSNTKELLLGAAAGAIGVLMFGPPLDTGNRPGVGGEYNWGMKHDESAYNQRRALKMVSSGRNARLMNTMPSGGDYTFSSVLSAMSGNLPETNRIDRDSFASRILSIG